MHPVCAHPPGPHPPCLVQTHFSHCDTQDSSNRPPHSRSCHQAIPRYPKWKMGPQPFSSCQVRDARLNRAPLPCQEGAKHLRFPAYQGRGSCSDPKEQQLCSLPGQLGQSHPLLSHPWGAQAGVTWMNRLSWVFCCSSRVFSCSREKMYSAVCWRMAACRRAGRGRLRQEKLRHPPKPPSC